PNTNYGSSINFISYDWTFSGTEALGYSLIYFDISSLPQNINIISAKLSLYHNPTSGGAGQAGNNACYLKKVTSQWDEDTVTWNILPSFSNINQVYLATSTSPNQNYPDIDIIDFVNDWYNNPQSNYGMILEIIDKSLYNSMKFCSSDYGDSSLRPKLQICWISSESSNNIQNKNYSISLYPNPNSGVFSFQYKNAPVNQNLSVQIFDITGSLIIDEQFEILSNHFIKNYNCRNLTSGIYYMKISDCKLTRTLKIIVE
ncbi:MAG: DNRLRE domain-containing protein, partial [Saprospiraceae bacterium]|nr:DNRLRE domain-containing protein [Saprospiraceae bacterium]